MRTIKHLLTALLLLCSTIATAHNFEVGGIFYNITSSTNKTVAVTYKGSYSDSYSNEYSGAVTIPASVSYNGTRYSVTTIGEEAFRYCTSLTSVTIPNSVTSIGYYTFQGCSSLKTVTIGNSVTSIGERAFENCSSLTSVTIPNSVTTIENWAFSGCSSLESIKVESGNTIYDSRDNCNAIIETATNTLIAGCKNTVIPNSVTTIGSSAFLSCSSLTSVTIPNSVTAIGNYAFSNCSSLTSVTIGNSVTTIGYGAFENCSSLKEVHITDIAAWCNIDFSNYYSNPLYYAKNLYLNGELVTNLVIPDSVTEIKEYAFYNCSSLTSITIPNSVTAIESYVFSGCSSLASIIIGNSVTTIGYGAFENCSSLESLTIPNSVITIEGCAFYNCTSLKEVYSKAEIFARISSDTFYGCYNATLYVPKGSKKAYQTAEYWSDFANIVEFEPEEDEDESIFGDLNGDGLVNIGDITILVNVILGKD